MSTPIDDGGPAFPTQQSLLDPRASGFYTRDGMTLRDWFAGKCPLTPESYAPVYGMELDEILRHPEHVKAFWMLFADERYRYADTMLAGRAKGGAK